MDLAIGRRRFRIGHGGHYRIRTPARTLGNNHAVTPARVLLRLRAELRLSGLAAWRALVRLVNGADLTHAAAIAYYALLSLFPFLLLVISILGSFTANEADRQAVLLFVFRYFPTQFDFVNSQLTALQQASLRVGVAGGFALIWASLGVFGAITSAVNQAWGSTFSSFYEIDPQSNQGSEDFDSQHAPVLERLT